MNGIYKEIAWTALAVTMMASGVSAQETTVRAVDSEQSQARIYLGSSSKPQLERNVGIARVSGKVEDKPGSSPTALEFTIYPADQRDDKISSNATVISFHSNRVQEVDDVDQHVYRATGELTVTYVERAATYGPAESYSGPEYGPERTYSVKQDASFDLRSVRGTEWVATSTLTGRAFPALLQAVADTTWPEYVNNKECSIAGNTGEDYSGPTCTGDVVTTAARTDIHCVVPTTTGEGYSGEICDGTPLQTPTGTRKNSYAVQNVETGNGKGTAVADAVKLVVNLRVGDANIAAAGSAGE